MCKQRCGYPDRPWSRAGTSLCWDRLQRETRAQQIPRQIQLMLGPAVPEAPLQSQGDPPRFACSRSPALMTWNKVYLDWLRMGKQRTEGHAGRKRCRMATSVWRRASCRVRGAHWPSISVSSLRIFSSTSDTQNMSPLGSNDAAPTGARTPAPKPPAGALSFLLGIFRT